MLPEMNQFVYELALKTFAEGKQNIDAPAGFSERIIEVPWAAGWFKSLLNKDSECQILDIGYTMSSLDWLGLLLHLRSDETVQLHAVDIVKPERVKSRYPVEWWEDIKSIPISIGDLRTMSIEDNKYDIVTCISTIEHIGFDEASENDPNSAFKRGATVEEVASTRSSTVNADVLRVFHKALKTDGVALITTPMGKGGATLLKDSLGFYTRQWEYEQESWNELVTHKGFKILDMKFARLDEDKIWRWVDAPFDLQNQSSELQPHAHGCALVALQKV